MLNVNNNKKKRGRKFVQWIKDEVLYKERLQINKKIKHPVEKWTENKNS